MIKVKTVCAIILNQYNEVLLIRRGRDPFKDYWALISGVGESRKGIAPDNAVQNEVFWDLGTKSFRGHKIFSIPVKSNAVTDEVIVYAGKIRESEIVLRSGYSEQVKWFPLKQVILEQLAFEHTDIIKMYLVMQSSIKW